MVEEPMEFELSWRKRSLIFKNPATTSRGVLFEKPSWYLFAKRPGGRLVAAGECGPIPGLSIDDLDLFESRLEKICSKPLPPLQQALKENEAFPAIQFGLESLHHDLLQKGDGILFPSAFTRDEASIPINGLVWMGDAEFMAKQIKTKLDAGYRCLKLKIGSLDFATECDLLKKLRQRFLPADLEIRVDANGAFTPGEALQKLERLASFTLHSIEQPIMPGQPHEMADLCQQSPLPIALDEELIFADKSEKASLIDRIRPQYLILKPSLLGGFTEAGQWIKEAEKRGIGWWATSALESNLGLSAIAQWIAVFATTMPQGLGTGQLYTNNIPAPLHLEAEMLSFKKRGWDYGALADLFTEDPSSPRGLRAGNN